MTCNGFGGTLNPTLLLYGTCCMLVCAVVMPPTAIGEDFCVDSEVRCSTPLWCFELARVNPIKLVYNPRRPDGWPCNNNNNNNNNNKDTCNTLNSPKLQMHGQ